MEPPLMEVLASVMVGTLAILSGIEVVKNFCDLHNQEEGDNELEEPELLPLPEPRNTD